MFSILTKIFIKDRDNVSDPKVREAYGTLSGAYGIFLNVVLFIIKLIAGLISKSLAITADAMNNLSDAGASIVTVLGFKLAGKSQTVIIRLDMAALNTLQDFLYRS